MKKVNPTARYFETNEWVEEKDGFYIIGITDFAQVVFGDIVFVELPEIDTSFKKGDPFAITESNKASNEIFMPMGGKILAINEALIDNPELLNTHPYSDGWLIVMEPTNIEEWSELMDGATYQKYIGAFFNKV